MREHCREVAEIRRDPHRQPAVQVFRELGVQRSTFPWRRRQKKKTRSERAPLFWKRPRLDTGGATFDPRFSQEGDQPMFRSEQQYVIVFNSEMINTH